MLETLAAIPPIQSAIRVEGESDGCVRIMLDCYLKSTGQLDELLALRGKELVVTLKPSN